MRGASRRRLAPYMARRSAGVEPVGLGGERGLEIVEPVIDEIALRRRVARALDQLAADHIAVDVAPGRLDRDGEHPICPHVLCGWNGACLAPGPDSLGPAVS